MIASIRDGVFPSPRQVHPSPRDSRVDEAAVARTATPPAPVSASNAFEKSSGISEASFSSDSISYYLKLRPQDASQKQQQQQQHQQQQQQQQQAPLDTVSAEPRRHFLKHQDSMKLSQDRIVKQLQLRQVNTGFASHLRMSRFFPRIF